jgi:hypothetical protein
MTWGAILLVALICFLSAAFVTGIALIVRALWERYETYERYKK